VTRRRYTKQEKLRAVAEAEVNGTEQAADKTGIPRSTIRYWMEDPKFAELRQKTREDLAEGFSLLAHMAQAELARRVTEMEPRDLTVLLGVATDKKLLLSGEATSRTESRSVTDGLSDDEKRRLRAAIAEAARAEGGSQRAGDGVEVPGEGSPATA
jgi:transposase-like protein